MNMKVRIFGTVMALLALMGFLREPSLDSAILLLPLLSVIAIFSEEIWEYYTRDPNDNGPKCPTCGYDVRATPIRCPECGTILPGEIQVYVAKSATR